MDILSFLILAGVAIPIGWIASMIGVGGGIFMVPLLALFFSHDVPTTQVAVGTSLGAIIFTSISSTAGYARQKVVDFKLGFTLMPSALAGALLGAYLTELISSDHLALVFGLILLYIAILMLWGKAPKDLATRFAKVDEEGNSKPPTLLVIAVGLIAGTASGFFGIGGGIVMVPALTILLGVDIVVAVATSLFVMGPIALLGTIEHALLDNVRYLYATALAIGIIIGAQLGSFVSTRVPKVFLRRLFGVVLIWSAYNMISKGLNLSL